MHVLIVDDHALFRTGLRYQLDELDTATILHEAGSYAEAKQHPYLDSADLILLDYHLPDTTGLSCLQGLRERCPQTQIVVLSGEENVAVIRSTIEAGASGYVPKSASSEVLFHALKSILAGGIYLPASALGSISPTLGDSATPLANRSQHILQLLTDRQHQILMCAVQGKPNKLIARDLELAEGTIKAHLSAAYQNLGVKNRTEAVFKLAQLGILINEQ
ncbi:MAG: response regulator transcription factor [Pseudomonadota bacterium]